MPPLAEELDGIFEEHSVRVCPQRPASPPLPGFVFTSLFLPRFSAMSEETLQRSAIILETVASLENKGRTRVVQRDQSDFPKRGVTGSSPAAAACED